MPPLAAIFALIFSLYELPTEAVPVRLAALRGAGRGVFAFGFARWRRRLPDARAAAPEHPLSAEGLPEPRERAEELYQELIRLLSDERARLDAASDRERRDAADYYACGRIR